MPLFQHLSPIVSGRLTKPDAPLKAGEVALVGAGPGDASLLTIAAAALIADCDVVVFDSSDR